MEAAAKLLTRRQGVKVSPVSPGVPPAGAPAGAPAVVPGATRASLPSVRSLAEKTTAISGIFITYLFYLSAAIFVIFLLLTFVHFTVTPIFSLTSGDQGILGIPTSQDKQTAWINSPADNKTSTALTNPKTCDYTISCDVFVPGEYKPLTAPRVLFYRSDAEVILLGSATPKDLLSTFPTTNILAYLDSSKNDLNLYVLTDKGKESLPPITNVPLGTPFRLSIAFMPSYLEVYLEGKLVATTVLQGVPVKSTSQFWGPPTSISSTVKIGNFYYWPRALRAAELQALISQSADFFTKT
jgi:hypothetical protein